MDESSGRVVWLTGLPASGKTTIARRLIQRLRARGAPILALDSDDLRPVLMPGAGYGPEGRDAFYDAIGHLAQLGAEGGSTVVVSATASRRAFRDRVRARVPRFIEVFVDCAPEILRARDPKGLYRRVAAGEIRNFPGVDEAYEPPEHAEIVLDSGRFDAERLVDELVTRLDAEAGAAPGRVETSDSRTAPPASAGRRGS